MRTATVQRHPVAAFARALRPDIAGTPCANGLIPAQWLARQQDHRCLVPADRQPTFSSISSIERGWRGTKGYHTSAVASSRLGQPRL